MYINTYMYVCTHTKCQHLPFDTSWIDGVHELLPLRKIIFFSFMPECKKKSYADKLLIILLYLI